MEVMHDVSREAARAAKPKALRLFNRYGVVGVGITRVGGKYAVQVNLETPLADEGDVPTSVDGVPVVVKYVGRVHKQPASTR